MARPKKIDGDLKDRRVPIVMSEAELNELDDWAFGHRIRSRGEAIRRLCQIGMAASSEKELLLDRTMRVMELVAEAVHLMRKKPEPLKRAVAEYIDWASLVHDLGLRVDIWESNATVDTARAEMAALEEIIKSNIGNANDRAE